MYSMVLCSLDLKMFFSIPDDDTLVLSVNYHISEHIICKSIDMWWVLILCLEKQNKTKQNHGQIRVTHFLSWLWK